MSPESTMCSDSLMRDSNLRSSALDHSRAGQGVKSERFRRIPKVLARRLRGSAGGNRNRRREGGGAGTPPPWVLRRGHLDGRDSLLVLFTRPDTKDLLDRHHEDLAVADLARARALQHGSHGRIDEVVRDADLQPHLVGQLHLHRRSAESLDLLPLAPVAVDAADREPLYVGL